MFLDTPEDARTMKEEIFGPVVHINTFKTEADVIAKANDTEYGLYASVFTKNMDRAMRMVKAMDSGFVSVNATSPTTAQDLPFGGYRFRGRAGRGGWRASTSSWRRRVLLFALMSSEGSHGPNRFLFFLMTAIVNYFLPRSTAKSRRRHTCKGCNSRYSAHETVM